MLKEYKLFVVDWFFFTFLVNSFARDSDRVKFCSKYFLELCKTYFLEGYSLAMVVVVVVINIGNK